MAVSEARKRANARYDKANCKQVLLKLYPKDHDLIPWLESKESRNAYLCELIRKDMEAGAEPEQ